MTLEDHPRPSSQLFHSLKCSSSSQVEIRVGKPTDEANPTSYFRMIIKSYGLFVDNASSSPWNSLEAVIEEDSADLIFQIISKKRRTSTGTQFGINVNPADTIPGPNSRSCLDALGVEEVLQYLHVQSLERLFLSLLDLNFPSTLSWATFTRKSTQQQPAHVDIPTRQLLLPNLFSIHLEDENFSEPGLCPLFMAIENMLIDRWNYDVPVHMLEIIEYRGFNARTQVGLGEVAGTGRINWDGHYSKPANLDSNSDFDHDDSEDPYYDDHDDDDDDYPGPLAFQAALQSTPSLGALSGL